MYHTWKLPKPPKTAPLTTTRSSIPPPCTHNEVQNSTFKASVPFCQIPIYPPVIASCFTAEEILAIIKLGTNSSFTWDEIPEIMIEVRRERIMQNLEEGDLNNALHLPTYPFTGSQIQDIVRRSREVYDAVYRKEILPLRIPYSEDQYVDGQSRVMIRYLNLRAKNLGTRYLVEKLWGDYSRLAQEVNSKKALGSKKRKAEEPVDRVVRGKKRWLGGTWYSPDEAFVISDSDDK